MKRGCEIEITNMGISKLLLAAANPEVDFVL